MDEITTNFLSLALELRQRIYKEALVSWMAISFQKPRCPAVPHGPVQAELRLANKYDLSPAVLRANKQIYREAALILYSRNHFQFISVRFELRPHCQSWLIGEFISQVGRRNTSLIRHVEIDFPSTRLESGYLELEDDDMKTMTLVQDAFLNITTFKLSLLERYQLQLNADRESWDLTEKLTLIRNCFKAAFKPKEIIVHLFVEETGRRDYPVELFKKPILDRGWRAELTILGRPGCSFAPGFATDDMIDVPDLAMDDISDVPDLKRRRNRSKKWWHALKGWT